MLKKVSSRDLLVIENAEDIDPTAEYAHDRGFRNDYELQHIIANTYKLVNFHRTLVFECLQQDDTWTYRDIEDVVDDEYYYVNASEHTSPELALQAYSYPEKARGLGNNEYEVDGDIMKVELVTDEQASRFSSPTWWRIRCDLTRSFEAHSDFVCASP